MKRYPHYWWQLRGKYCPSRIAVLDCDMAGAVGPGKPQPCPDRVTAWHIAWSEMRHGAPTCRRWRAGEDVGYLWPLLSSLCTSKETTWVFISWAIRVLTATDFWDRLEDGRMIIEGKDWTADRGEGKSGEDRTDGLCCIENPPTLILCRPCAKNGKLLILDTRNYGIETEYDNRACGVRSSEMLEGILSIVRTLRQGRAVSLRGTAASQAVQILRTRFDCVRLHCHTSERVLQIERDSYIGGRVEAYRTGEIEGPVWHLDVRNMYPSVCLELPVPVSLREYTSEPSAAYRLAGKCPSECCAIAHIRENGSQYPVRGENGIAYPNGPVRAALGGPELQRAWDTGAIVSISAAARYTCAPVLSGFYQWGLSTLEAARRSGDGYVQQWIKRVMNALVGKFGEPGRRWVARPSITEQGPYDEFGYPGPDGESVRHRNVAWNTQRLETHGESYWSMPAVAGWITSAARVRLWDYIAAAGRQNVWYVDTDGMLCGQTGYDRLLRGGLIRDGEVGHLRVVGSYSRCFIYGIRHYVLGDSIKCAGVPHGAIRETETRADFFRRTGAAAETTLGYIRRMRGEDINSADR